MLLPPPSNKPRPLTLMLPSALTSALRSAITQSWPGGWTPRTMFRFTLSTICAVASVGATATPAETGMTPIPPLNFTRESSAAAESGVTITRNSTQADIFFNMASPPSSLDEKQTGQAPVYIVERQVIPPRESCVGDLFGQSFSAVERAVRAYNVPHGDESRSICGGTHERATDPESGRNQSGRRPLSFRLRRARANARRRGLFHRRRPGGRRRAHAGRPDHHQARHRLPPAFAPERAVDLRAQGQGARLGGRPAGDRRLTRHLDLRSTQRRAFGRGASRRRPGVLHRKGPLARHRRHARGLGNGSLSAGPAQAHVGFPADDEVVRIHLLLGRGDAILLLGLPARRLDGTGYELALGIELRELEPHALHAHSELRRQGLDAPRGGVGRHEGEHALAQGQACHGSIPYLSHLAMSASSTL